MRIFRLPVYYFRTNLNIMQLTNRLLTLTVCVGLALTPAFSQKKGVYDASAPRPERLAQPAGDKTPRATLMNPVFPKGTRQPSALTDVTMPLAKTLPGLPGRAKAPQFVLGDGTELYGSLLYSNQWVGTTGAYGIYKFPASTYSLPEMIYEQGAYEANGGGCYNDGKYYWNTFVYTDEMGYTFTTFNTYDFRTHEYSRNILSFINENFDLQQITNALTFDPSEGRMFALANIKVVDEFGYIARYYPAFSEVDPYSGFCTPIAQIPPMLTLASTPGGEIFAISQGADAKLYRINKNTGDYTLIGSTGISADYAQSMCFDPITGKLYWAAVQSNGRSGLYEVNTTTGHASLIFFFDNNEEYTGLYIPEPEVNSGAPAIVTDIATNFAGPSHSGSVTVTAPSKTFGGAALSGNFTLTFLTDNSNPATFTVAPGQSVSIDRTLEEGIHSFTAYASNSEGDGARRTLSTYVGIDAPAAVGNLTLQPTDDGKAHISWTAPTIGRHDGYVDPAQLTYTITRYPDEAVVARNISATYYTDPVNLPAGNFSYEVTPSCGGREGISSMTDTQLFGHGSNLPVSFGFESKEAYELFTVIDANNDWDAQYSWGGWMYGPDFKYAAEDGNCAVYGYHPESAADDWLITPPVTVEQGKKYRVNFTLWTRGDKENIAVTAGPHNTVAAQSVILPTAEYNHKDRRIYTADFTASESGNYYVGFHITSAKKRFYAFITDIVVDVVPDEDSPAAVANLTATPGANGANSATITFTAPSTTVAGTALSSLDKVEIFHGNNETPVYTAHPTPGATVSWTDTEVSGWVDYRVVPYASGKAGAKAETRIYVGWDTPLAVENLTVSDATGAPVVTWTAPTAGVNGGYIDSSKLTYSIYRYEDDMQLLSRNISGTTYTDDELDGSFEQHLVAYLVVAQSSAGTSEPNATDYIVFGDPYSGEFSESFADASVHSTPWVMYRLKGNTQNWGVTSYGTHPSCVPVGYDDGMAVYTTDGRVGDEGLLVSPKLDISSIPTPTFSFYFYHNYTDEHIAWEEGFEDRMIPEVMLPDGSRIALHEPIYVDDLGTGWLKYSCDLTPYRNQPYIRLALHGITACEQDVYVDQLEVTNLISNDLTCYSFTGNGRVEAGKSASYKLTVFNRGAADVEAGSYSVTLLDGKQTVETIPGEAIESKGYKTYIFTRNYSVEQAGTTHTLSAEIEWADDEVPGNNVSESVVTEVLQPALPEVGDLAASVDDTNKNVTLTWGMPNALHISDSFEDHLPYEITDFGDYTLFDGDGNPTWGFSNVYFDNTGEPQSFMVFNPVELGIVDYASSLFPYDCFDPHSGNQVLACFQGYNLSDQGYAVSATNDDWIISPEVFGGQTISFFAKSGDYMQGIDKFEVLYSTTDNRAASFRKLSDVVSATQSWEQYSFTLPAEAKYFAIHCVSEDGFILYIDDLVFVERRDASGVEHTGFRLYRDGIMLSEFPTTTTSFADNSLADGTYTYYVTSLYANGRESSPSNKVKVVIGNGGVSAAVACTASVRTQGSNILVDCDEESSVRVISADGKIVYTAHGASHKVNVTGGVYIVTVGGEPYRVIVR